MISANQRLMAIFVIHNVIVGAMTGFLSGRIAEILVTRNWKSAWRLSGIGRDILAGGLVFPGALIALSLIRWPSHTIEYDLPGGAHVVSTVTGYQHPYRVAYAAAILLPALLELLIVYRRRQAAAGVSH
jgi:hypothetical protein